MASENPHLLEKLIHTTFSVDALTGTFPGNFADRITNLSDAFPTGDRRTRSIYDRLIKEYFRRLDHFGFANLQTDLTDAGFTPKSITGFFDLAKNGLLVNFFGASNSAYIWSMRKVNTTYTGYACRIRRESDNMEVDVKFNSDDIVSNDSEVVLAATGFNPTGLLRTDGVATMTYPQSSPCLNENTLSGFLKVNNGRMMTEGGTEFTQNAYVTKWYNQGVGVDLTGAAVDETVELTSFTNVITAEEYVNSFRGPGSIPYTLSSGLAYADDNIVRPVYTRQTEAGGMKRYTLYVNDFGSNSPFGKRWIITRSDQSSNNDAIFQTGTINALSDARIMAYSNTTLEDGSLRPYEHTSWSVKLDDGVTYDNTTTATWSLNTLNSQPLIADSGHLTTYGHTSPIAALRFKDEGNSSMLGSNASVDFNTGTISTTFRLNSTGTADQIIYRLGAGTGTFAGPTKLQSGHFLAYGAPVGGAEATYYTNMSGAATSPKRSVVQIIDNDAIANGVADGSAVVQSTNLEQHDLVKNVIIHDLGPTGTEIFVNASGLDIQNSSYTGKLGGGILQLGANSSLLQPFIGEFYEFIGFDNDPKNTNEEASQYTGQSMTHYKVNQERIPLFIKSDLDRTDFNLTVTTPSVAGSPFSRVNETFQIGYDASGGLDEKDEKLFAYIPYSGTGSEFTLSFTGSITEYDLIAGCSVADGSSRANATCTFNVDRQSTVPLEHRSTLAQGNSSTGIPAILINID